jgi:hypothetical protein
MSPAPGRATSAVRACFPEAKATDRAEIPDASCVARTLLVAPATVTMVSRSTACCLALLVLLPFTAPFRTCDLAGLFGGAPAQHLPANRPGSAALNTDSPVANVPALARAGRVRLLEVSNASDAPGAACRTTATHLRAAAVSHSARERLVFATILRV